MEFSKRVLIVDDEPSVVGVLQEFFARFRHGHAYVVVSASSAAEALDILLRGAFDLILLDMVIPGIGARWKQGLEPAETHPRPWREGASPHDEW